MREAIIFGSMLFLTGFVVGYWLADLVRERRETRVVAKKILVEIRCVDDATSVAERQKAMIAEIDREFRTFRPTPGRPS